MASNPKKPLSRPSEQTPVGELVEQAAEQVRVMLQAGIAQCEILAFLVNTAERVAGPGAIASILVIDKDGLLRNGASPNLPSDYLSAIDRLKPDAKVGTCAAAAATGLVVVTPDFYADDKWAELRHLPLSLGLVAAWSRPIKSSNGTVLGTFGTYFRERRSPRPEEMRSIEVLAALAAEVLAQTGEAND